MYILINGSNSRKYIVFIIINKYIPHHLADCNGKAGEDSCSWGPLAIKAVSGMSFKPVLKVMIVIRTFRLNCSILGIRGIRSGLRDGEVGKAEVGEGINKTELKAPHGV